MEHEPEFIPLPCDIPGVGREGDFIVHDPTHPKPHLRLTRVCPLDERSLPMIRQAIKRASSPFRGSEGSAENPQSSHLRAL